MKISKVKKGKMYLIHSLKGKGTPAIKRITEEELNLEDMNITPKQGQGIFHKRSIKPLQFRL